MQQLDRQIREKIIALRGSGMTYPEIQALTGVAKSTLSYWLRQLPIPARVVSRKRAHLARIQQMGALANHNRRNKEIVEIVRSTNGELRKQIINDPHVGKYLLAILYWAEGSKRPFSCGINFANTDPALIVLFLDLFRRSYALEEKKIRIRLHLHAYHDVGRAKAFWSQLTNVPFSQFQKTYVKPRSKTKRFRENFMGICFVRYNDTNLKHQIMVTAYGIQKTFSNPCQAIVAPNRTAGCSASGKSNLTG